MLLLFDGGVFAGVGEAFDCRTDSPSRAAFGFAVDSIEKQPATTTPANAIKHKLLNVIAYFSPPAWYSLTTERADSIWIFMYSSFSMNGIRDRIAS